MLSPLAGLLLLHLICTTSASATSITSINSSRPAYATKTPCPTTVSTCPSRTANIFTHNLPQQCLPSSRKGADGLLSTNGTITATAVQGNTSVPTEVSVHSSNSTVKAEYSGRTPGIGQDQESNVKTSKNDTPPAVPAEGLEEQSPLEDEKFMSFEDWKKQNLQKAGQSEHLGRDSRVDRLAQRDRTPNLQTALDTLGDDAEIELDFSGFLPDAPDLKTPIRAVSGDNVVAEQPEDLSTNPPKIKSGSKDAGTTCKERFNYASFDCAANILKTNAEAISPSAVLGENKDSYMLNVCSATNKYLILELCDDISIDTIVLANYEFFSSIFRTFRVSVSDKYPVKTEKWKTLGTFEARNTRDIQAFLIENPVIWARYLRVEFLTHYGHEYYCPLSLLRVHGTTMLEEYKHDLENAQAEGDEDSDNTEPAIPGEEALVPEAVADKLLQKNQQHPSSSDSVPTSSTADTLMSMSEVETASAASVSPMPLQSTAQSASSGTIVPASPTVKQSSEAQKPSQGTTDNVFNASMPVFASVPAMSNHTSSLKPHSSTSLDDTNAASSNETAKLASPTGTSAVVNGTAGLPRNVTSSERTKPTGSATQSPAAMPTMQESFFKSVQKRLQMLESNSSLSLQYIEDQSRALREAFSKVEQRQLAKTGTFLEHLNNTVLSELREFRQQYDQLWQSTVIELEVQRERYHHETEAMNARLGILADELIFQKRIAILQMLLVLICLALVLFTRGAFDQYMDLPLVQSVLARSPSSRWLNTAGLDTPTQSPPASRQNSTRKRQGILKGHVRMQSADSMEDTLSPNDLYTPPTPVSITYDDASDGEQLRSSDAMDDPEFDPSAIERPSTSPPELQSVGASTPELEDFDGNESIDSRLVHMTPERPSGSKVPRVIVEEATPPPKQLSWRLPTPD